MNKYQKAIEQICTNMLCGGECTVGGKPCCLLEPIQVLVDKSTPKKVKLVYEDDWDEFGNRMIFEERCPICNQNISDIGGAYCHSCGQALDWS